MKILFLLLLFFSDIVYADYLYTPKTYCAISWDDTIVGNCEIKKSNGDTVYENGNCNDSDFIDGYVYDSDKDTCEQEKVMDQDTWNKNMALLANLLGFTLTILLGFVTILIARR